MSSALAVVPPKLDRPTLAEKKPAEKKPTRKKIGLALWMERVLEECDRAGAGFEADPVHDLRVALRRCRSVADGLMAMDPDPEWKRMKKAGKRLFSSLGELRDVQVMKEWVQRLAPADDREAQVLMQGFASREMQLKLEAANALKEFDRKQWKKWSTTLPRRGAKLRPGTVLFKHLALEKWNAAYELHRIALRNRSKVAFHSLRIGLKRFRYIVENFLPEQHLAWKDDLKELQDLLGEVHDLDVLWAAALQANAFPDPESRTRWQKTIADERASRIVKYREKMVGKNSLWPVWRAELPQGDQIETAALRRIKLWASYLDPDFPHSERVAKLSLQLYDGISSNGLWGGTHNDQAERIALQIAALVHDVGRSQGEKKSRKSTFKLVSELPPPLGIEPETLKMAGTVARYHSGALPQSGQKSLSGLIQSERQTVNRLAGILRLAEAFDADRSGRIHNAVLTEDKGFLQIALEGYSARDPLGETVAAARHLLETVLKRPIFVKPVLAKRLPQTRKSQLAHSTSEHRLLWLEAPTLLPS